MLECDEAQLADRLQTHVERLAGLIGSRHIERPSSMEAAAAYVEHELSALGNTVERQTYEIDGQSVANLIVERRGIKKPDEIVILGAHYDTVPTTPGADDNASAVAVLIEVARLLQSHRPSRTIRFVAFACEEPPHFHMDTMGSQVYARHCRKLSEKIIGMLCLEMLGYYTTEPGSQQTPEGIPRCLKWLFPKRGNFLAAVGNLQSWKLGWTFRRGFKKAVRFPLFSVALPEKINAIRLSDNSSFWDQGYRALMITDTSFLRNQNYHTATDTPETLDYVRMAKAAIGVAGGLGNMARLTKTKSN